MQPYYKLQTGNLLCIRRGREGAKTSYPACSLYLGPFPDPGWEGLVCAWHQTNRRPGAACGSSRLYTSYRSIRLAKIILFKPTIRQPIAAIVLTQVTLVSHACDVHLFHLSPILPAKPMTLNLQVFPYSWQTLHVWETEWSAQGSTVAQGPFIPGSPTGQYVSFYWLLCCCPLAIFISSSVGFAKGMGSNVQVFKVQYGE